MSRRALLKRLEAGVRISDLYSGDMVALTMMVEDNVAHEVDGVFYLTDIGMEDLNEELEREEIEEDEGDWS